ncbi:hypothetical protein SCUP234_02194 [Seiridium cupressi]
MSRIERVYTDKAPKPLPQFSQAVKYNGTVYCSGNIGFDPATFQLVEGGVKEQTRRALRNLSTVLEEAGSSLNNVVKVNIFLTTMDNFAAMNEAWDEFFTQDVKPHHEAIVTSTSIKIAGMNNQTGRRLFSGTMPLTPRGTSVFCSPRATIPHSSRQLASRSVSRACYRYASSSAAAEAKKPTTIDVAQAPVTTPLDATSSPTKTLDPDVAISSTLNPPATTRPPPLNIPVRAPDSSLISYLFSVGKTYIAFYKNGLKAINTNRKLLKEVTHNLSAPAHLKGSDTKVRPTRAAVLLRERTTHDMSRLPVFGLALLVFGEFTPLVVLVFPKLTPYTCRIPKQIEKLRKNAQDRREASMQNMRHITDSNALDKIISGHVVRSLGLGSSIWDKVGIDPPFSAARAKKAVSRIFNDDIMIRDGGGVSALEPDEVVLACEDRAMDVRSEDVGKLRSRLEKWVEESTKGEGAAGEAIVTSMLIGFDGEAK